MTLLHRPERQVWRMPIGYLLDQIECYYEFHSEAAEPGSRIAGSYIDELMPPDL